MLKLYHIPSEGDPFGGSRNGCKALIVLEEVGEPYELVRLSRMSDCRPPDAPFRKINPNGVTPAIDDDGLIVWESAAVLQHLAMTRPTANLLPKGASAQAMVWQWLAWEGATYTPALLAMFYAATKPQPDSTEVEEAKSSLIAKLTILDDALAGKDYLCGAYSVADIALGAIVPIAFLLSLDLTGFSNIIGWLRRLRDRPAFQKADAVRADMAAGEQQLS